MKNTWKWIVGVVLVLTIMFALPFLWRAILGYSYGGMMGNGYGYWRHPMMGYGYSPFGGLFMGFGMLSMWIVPLGLLFLVIYGAVRLANKPRLPTATQACANCGKATQADWKNCPYCGAGL